MNIDVYAISGRILTFCIDKHLASMYFRQRFGWHCALRDEARKKLPREFTFSSSAKWLRGLDLNQRPLGYEFLNEAIS
jgi:hypothetical protein